MIMRRIMCPVCVHISGICQAYSPAVCIISNVSMHFFIIYFAFFIITDSFCYTGLLLCRSLFLPCPSLSRTCLAHVSYKLSYFCLLLFICHLACLGHILGIFLYILSIYSLLLFVRISSLTKSKRDFVV